MSESSSKTVVTLIEGDGIGPEVTGAAIRILEEAGANLEYERVQAGAEVFKSGVASGVPKETVESIIRNGVALKGPLETPVGFGEKSANVTLRKVLELYGNIRPARNLPGVQGTFAGRDVDIAVVRENVEDLYAGIEHMQTPGVAQCLKLISRKGCEKIVRLAFEYARSEGRGSVHCATKANIMKLTEGLLKRTFEDIAPEYPEIKAEHIIVDNCAHMVVRDPERFEVIVSTNMNGDILSDLTAGMTGGLGLAPSANIGKGVAVFEAVHGSAPTIAGKDVANPTALILSAVMMLRHLGKFDIADTVEQAVYVTLEAGKTLTIDLHSDADASSTTAYTDAIIGNLGKSTARFHQREHKPIKIHEFPEEPDMVRAEKRRHVGADLFIEEGIDADALGRSLEQLAEETPLRLKMISNRGTKVYPGGAGRTDCIDHWRCRFILRDESAVLSDDALIPFVQKVAAKHPWMHIEKLLEVDGKPAYSKAQGED